MVLTIPFSRSHRTSIQPRRAVLGRVLGRAIVALLPALDAANAQQRDALPPIGTPAKARIVWPAPPEQARIQYTSVLASDLDLRKDGGAMSGLRKLLGGTPVAGVAVQRPHDVAADSRGRLYVTGGVPTTVRLYDPVTRTARTVGNTGANRVSKPMGLAVDGQDNVYVADQGAKRVLVYAPSGEYVRSYGDDGLFLNPVDVSIDRGAGIVYVADAYLHQVLAFRAADGQLLRRIGKDLASDKKRRAAAAASMTSTHGTAKSDSTSTDRQPPTRNTASRDIEEHRGVGPGQFRFPAFVIVASDGTLYVADGLNARVQAFDRAGKLLREIGQLGNGPGAFTRPKGVAVDSEGHLYVVDAAFSNVQIFDAQGRILMAFSSGGRGPGDLLMPSGISIDTQDRIYVADRMNDRVQVFTFLRSGAGAPRP